MATIGTGVTYLDFASRLDPKDKISGIIELLTKTNTILEDMQVIEGNLMTGYKSCTAAIEPKCLVKFTV